MKRTKATLLIASFIVGLFWTGCGKEDGNYVKTGRIEYGDWNLVDSAMSAGNDQTVIVTIGSSKQDKYNVSMGASYKEIISASFGYETSRGETRSVAAVAGKDCSSR